MLFSNKIDSRYIFNTLLNIKPYLKPKIFQFLLKYNVSVENILSIEYFHT